MADTAHDGAFTVVLLDDEPPVLDAIHDVVVKLRPQWSVIRCADSDDCFRTCKTVSPDVVVVDEMLEGDQLQGHDVVKRLWNEKRETNASVPILVVLTQLERGDLIRKGYPLGQAFINKQELGKKPELLVEQIEEIYRRDVPDAKKRLGA